MPFLEAIDAEPLADAREQEFLLVGVEPFAFASPAEML